ncbi:hypothetical protein [Sphingomonas sp. PvP055]|uniref:hypothetical protein n=1 Tax=Sphingomonas sp. PvP055 TaxID=3156391 RepID=UPI003390B3DA
MNDWDLRPNGDVAVVPLCGWQTAAAPLTLLLRLKTTNSAERLQKEDFDNVQIALTIPQARELAQDLLRMAAVVEAQPKGTMQ